MSDPDLDFRNQQGDGTAVVCVAVGTIALLTINHFLGSLLTGLLVALVGGAIGGYLFCRSLKKQSPKGNTEASIPAKTDPIQSKISTSSVYQKTLKEELVRGNVAKEFRLSFFSIKIETDTEHYPFKLIATDSRTNQFAFSYGLELSPFATCLVCISADGSRYNMSPPHEKVNYEIFERLAIDFAITRIYDDQLIPRSVLHAIGVQALAEKISKADFQIFAIKKDEDGGPQIIGMKDGVSSAVIVRADVYPNKGELWDITTVEVEQLVEHHRQRGQDLYYASVMLINAEARNDCEKQVLLRDGSYRMSVEAFDLLTETPKIQVSEGLESEELSMIAEFGALIASALADAIKLPKHIENMLHPEYSILGLSLVHRVYLDFTGKKDRVLWNLLGIMTTPPYVTEAFEAGSEDEKMFEQFANPAILAYDYEADQHLIINPNGKSAFADFSAGAANVLLTRMNSYEGFSASLINMKTMQDVISNQAEVMVEAFKEMESRRQAS